MKRENFESNLLILDHRIQQLGQLANDALNKAFTAFIEKDHTSAQAVMKEDAVINAVEIEVNQLAIWLIAQQQPVAKDLRRIISIVKMASSLERIADFAVNIAKSTLKIKNPQRYMHTTSFPQMKGIASEMLQMTVTAFMDSNLPLANDAGALDTKVDMYHDENVAILKNLIQSNPLALDDLFEFILLNRYLERIADHVTNMAEAVAYMIKGEIIRLN